MDAKATVAIGPFSRKGNSRVATEAVDHDFHPEEKVTPVGILPRFGAITTLLITLDNGPENHSRRTQFIQRLVDFVDHTGLTVQLAYYPPYHSKYNPIERCWGVLEHHWNGSLLHSLHTALAYIESMTWRGVHPVVRAVSELYESGVSLTQAAMALLEQRLARDPLLGKWFVTIAPKSGLG